MIENEKLINQPIDETDFHAAETRHKGILSALVLAEENVRYADSPGISDNNRDRGFLPAFQDVRSGCCRISRFADGRPAPIHVLDGLPQAWVAERGVNGRVISTLPHIVSGFLRNGSFYTREEATRFILNQDDDLV